LLIVVFKAEHAAIRGRGSDEDERNDLRKCLMEYFRFSHLREGIDDVAVLGPANALQAVIITTPSGIPRCGHGWYR
jgi:hypothetical protein